MKSILDKIIKNKNPQDPKLLVRLINKIRPANINEEGIATEQIHNLLAHLKSDQQLKDSLVNYIRSLFSNYDPIHLYSESGILSNKGFFSEFWSRIKHKILPPEIVKDNAVQLINLLFYKKNDYLWVDKLANSLLSEVLEVLEVYEYFQKNKDIQAPLSNAIQLLSHNIVATSLDQSFKDKMHDINKLDSPFLIQNRLITQFMKKLVDHDFTLIDQQFREEIFCVVDRCTAQIILLRKNKNKYGTSLHLIYLMRRLIHQLNRLKALLSLITAENKNAFYNSFSGMIKLIIRSENQKNSLKLLVNENIDLLAFEIVEHSARKGEKYIADNKNEYWAFFKSSLLGGFVIAFFASFKIFADGFDLSPLGKGLVYSFNYSLCFVLVYIWGGIIATKQPAMTASSIVRYIDKNNDGCIDSLHNLKELVIKVSRSQYVSFLGNILCALPIAFLLAYLFEFIIGSPILTEYKTEALINDLRPIEGGSLYFAGIAGIFLSLSGLISGYVDNKIVFSKIPKRINEHPVLQRWLPKTLLERFSRYTENEMGGLSGNISLGLFLGMAGTIGFITGLPIDIRHIAFSTANFGFVLASDIELFSLNILAISIIGILGIGFFNFLVSFGITLFIALKSRKITFSQTKELSLLIMIHFKNAPLDFFFPPDWTLRYNKLFQKTTYLNFLTKQ